VCVCLCVCMGALNWFAGDCAVRSRRGRNPAEFDPLQCGHTRWQVYNHSHRHMHVCTCRHARTHTRTHTHAHPHPHPHPPKHPPIHTATHSHTANALMRRPRAHTQPSLPRTLNCARVSHWDSSVEESSFWLSTKARVSGESGSSSHLFD